MTAAACRLLFSGVMLNAAVSGAVITDKAMQNHTKKDVADSASAKWFGKTKVRPSRKLNLTPEERD
jgi:hypothetical protein